MSRIIIGLLLALVACVTVVGCGGDQNPDYEPSVVKAIEQGKPSDVSKEKAKIKDAILRTHGSGSEPLKLESEDGVVLDIVRLSFRGDDLIVESEKYISGARIFKPLRMKIPVAEITGFQHDGNNLGIHHDGTSWEFTDIDSSRKGIDSSRNGEVFVDPSRKEDVRYTPSSAYFLCKTREDADEISRLLKNLSLLCGGTKFERKWEQVQSLFDVNRICFS